MFSIALVRIDGELLGGAPSGALDDAVHGEQGDGLSDVLKGQLGDSLDDALSDELGDAQSNALLDDDNLAYALKDHDKLVMDAIGLHRSIQVLLA